MEFVEEKGGEGNPLMMLANQFTRDNSRWKANPPCPPFSRTYSVNPDLSLSPRFLS